MHIAIVDPSRTILKIVGQLIESADHRAHPFTDGIEALNCLRLSQVEALITSVELPTISGIELCRQARMLSTNLRPIYIMVMSSNYEQAKLVEALKCGADDFIGKPPAVEELYARLRAAQRFATMQRDLVRMATSDPLTGLLNRRAFFEKADEVCAQAYLGTRLSAVMLDIDHFKNINDHYGHGVGDQAIRAVAQIIGGDNEIAGRLGGEEFVLLLKDRPLAEAVTIAEKIRGEIASLRIETEVGEATFTCSFGVEEWKFGDMIDELVRRADKALYSAKASGRNRVVTYSSEMSSPDACIVAGPVRAVAR